MPTRSDGRGVTSGLGTASKETMDVVAYLRILRRHWRMIAVAAVVGALIGAGSTVFTHSGSTTGSAKNYYEATHTLLLDPAMDGTNYRPVYTNVDQLSVLTTTGDVPQAVADKLGGNARDLATHIYITTNTNLGTMDISAAEPSPHGAVQLADTFAQALKDDIVKKETARLDGLASSTQDKLTTLRQQIADADAQIAAKAGDLSILTAQRNSLVNAYTTTYERFQGIANAPDPSGNLTTLQGAEPNRISAGEYNARITAGQLGRNHVRADYTPTASDNSAALA